MPVLFSVNCKRPILFSVKRNPDPPPPPPLPTSTLFRIQYKIFFIPSKLTTDIKFSHVIKVHGDILASLVSSLVNYEF